MCDEAVVLTDGRGVHGASSSWPRRLTWMVAALVVSTVLTVVCIIAGATVAMMLEVGVDPLVGRLINAGTLMLTVLLYSGVLLLILRAITSHWEVPGTTWIGLGLFAMVWAVLSLASPAGPYSPAPAVVNAIGALLSWVLIGRTDRARPQASVDAGAPG